MTSDQVSRTERRREKAIRPGWAQRVMALASITAAVVTIVFIQHVSAIEAATTAFWLSSFVTDGAVAVQDNFVVHVDGVPIAFHVTPSCSAAVLLAPALVMYGVILLIRRMSFVRAATAAAVMIAVIFTTNQLRLGLIGWASQTWGMDVGYELSHRYVGSALAIVGFTIGVALLFVITPSNRRTARTGAAA